MTSAGISRVAILRKVTFLERLRQNGQTLAAGPSRLQALVDDRVLAAHESHQSATDLVSSYLKLRRVDVRMKEKLTKADIDWAQLVISLGGDGTFLRTSHHFEELEKKPILGINSSPESSFGFYCAADASGFPELFEGILSDKIRPRPLWRMRILINGVKHPVLVLNDALFAANSAATTLYYSIRHGSEVQVQKSSGVWISTPAGSTAGILSAGGCIQPWSSRLLQFRVRELFPASIDTNELPIIGGLFDSNFELVPRMASAKLYIDGSNRSADVGFNDRITFEPSEQPINWIASPDADHNRHEFKQLMRKFWDDCTTAESQFQHQQAELLRF